MRHQMEQDRTRSEMYVHLVWATHMRLPLIAAGNEQSIHHLLQSEAQKQKCAVIATGGVEDHVHALIKLHTTVSVSHLVKQMKGVSSRAQSISADGDAFRWQSGYSATSIHKSLLSKVKSYVQNQKRHHTDGLVWAELEAVDVTGEPNLNLRVHPCP
jgi:putative transposase